MVGEAGDKQVQVAFADDQIQAEMIQGLLGEIPSVLQPSGLNGPRVGIGAFRPGYGFGVGGSWRVMVRADQAEAAKAILAETMVEDPEADWPEIANATNLEAASGRGPRNYGMPGAFARIYLWAIVIFAVFLGYFLLTH